MKSQASIDHSMHSEKESFLVCFFPMLSINAGRELQKSFKRTTELARVKLLKRCLVIPRYPKRLLPNQQREVSSFHRLLYAFWKREFLGSFSPMSSIDTDRELHKSFKRTIEEARIKLLKCMLHCCIKCPQNIQVKTFLQTCTAFTCRIYNEILL